MVLENLSSTPSSSTASASDQNIEAGETADPLTRAIQQDSADAEVTTVKVASEEASKNVQTSYQSAPSTPTGRRIPKGLGEATTTTSSLLVKT